MSQADEQQPLDLDEIASTAEEPSQLPDQPAKEDESSQRPDPTFKRVVEKGAEEWKVGSKPTELKTKQLTSPDLLLEVPPGTNLEGSPFDFFRRYNIIEFKSRNDKLTYGKFKAQLGRVHIWGSEHEEIADEDILNVIVAARNPRELRLMLAGRGLDFKLKDTQVTGIYSGKLDLQDLALVVCSELPVEPKYAIWLLFADPNSAKWRNAVRMMAENGLIALLEEAEKLNPKEYRAMSSDIKERLRHYRPEEMAEVMQAIQELTEDHLLNDLGPEQRRAVLSKLPMQERLKDVPAEERLKGLPVEERLKGLPTEQLGDALSKLPPEELAKLLQRLQPPKQD